MASTFYERMKKAFKVEFTMSQGRKAVVVATQLQESDFQVTEFSFLAGVPIERSLSQPRKIKEDGSPDYDTFVFTLRSQADKDKFQVDDLVELEEKKPNEPEDQPHPAGSSG